MLLYGYFDCIDKASMEQQRSMTVLRGELKTQDVSREYSIPLLYLLLIAFPCINSFRDIVYHIPYP